MSVIINMVKARVIHLERIRRHRDNALQALDVEFFIALERKDTERITTVESEKQRLRDIPQNVQLEQYITPESLDEFWPVGLSRDN